MALFRNPWTWFCAAVVLTLPLVAWQLFDTSTASSAAAAIQNQREQVAATALSLLMSEEGFTVDSQTGRSVGAIDAWAVSLAGAEERHRTLPSVAIIAQYLARQADRFAASPNVYFGGWHDRVAGEWVLDVTCLTPERRHAVAIGQLNNQRCIFHLQTREEYWLPQQTIFTSVSNEY